MGRGEESTSETEETMSYSCGDCKQTIPVVIPTNQTESCPHCFEELPCPFCNGTLTKTDLNMSIILRPN